MLFHSTTSAAQFGFETESDLWSILRKTQHFNIGIHTVSSDCHIEAQNFRIQQEWNPTGGSPGSTRCDRSTLFERSVFNVIFFWNPPVVCITVVVLRTTVVPVPKLYGVHSNVR